MPWRLDPHVWERLSHSQLCPQRLRPRLRQLRLRPDLPLCRQYVHLGWQLLCPHPRRQLPRAHLWWRGLPPHLR